MKEYRQINLSDWHQVGEGGNGKTYENPAEPDKLLKVNEGALSMLDAVEEEFNVSSAVERLGVPVPKMHEVVRVGDVFGAISQRIKDKKSLARICNDEPERTEEMARLLCSLGRQMWDTPCDTSFFPNRKAQVLKAIDGATFISRRKREVIRSFAESVPESTNCVHGDCQMGNVISADGKLYWIDLGRFAYGNPMFDIGHLYQLCMVYSPMKRVQELFHMTLDQFHRFWDAFAKAYTGKEEHSEFDAEAGRFAAMDVIFRTLLVPPSFVEKLFFGMHVNRLFKKFYKQ